MRFPITTSQLFLNQPGERRHGTETQNVAARQDPGDLPFGKALLFFGGTVQLKCGFVEGDTHAFILMAYMVNHHVEDFVSFI